MNKCCPLCVQNAKLAHEFEQRYIKLMLLTRAYERSSNGYIQLSKYVEEMIEKYGDKRRKEFNQTVYNDLLEIVSQIERIDHESFEGMGKNDG